MVDICYNRKGKIAYMRMEAAKERIGAVFNVY